MTDIGFRIFFSFWRVFCCEVICPIYFMPVFMFLLFFLFNLCLNESIKNVIKFTKTIIITLECSSKIFTVYNIFEKKISCKFNYLLWWIYFWCVLSIVPTIAKKWNFIFILHYWHIWLHFKNLVWILCLKHIFIRTSLCSTEVTCNNKVCPNKLHYVTIHLLNNIIMLNK